MKLLKACRTLGESYSAKAMLEGHGFRVHLKNEFGSNTAGAGPTGILGFSLPELWLLDDDQFEDAHRLLNDFQDQE